MTKKNYKYRNKIKKPKEYSKMIQLVESVSRKLKRHCRIDVYCINDKVYIGEFTFFCGARLHSFLCNFILGLLWIIYRDDYSYEDDKLKQLVPEYYNDIV